MKFALIQLNAGSNKKSNIENACKLVEKAAKSGAKTIILPEVFNYRGSLIGKELYDEIGEDVPGESINPLISIAKSRNVNIISGSIYERANSEKKVYNSCVVIDQTGSIIDIYRKINLFKAIIDGKKIDEANTFIPGDKTVITKIQNIKIGISICYDLRFPELYREYFRKKVDVIVVLSSFTFNTGKYHWEPLLRARAIENYCHVLAPNQFGVDGNNIKTYGNTIIINPNGDIVDSLSCEEEGILISELVVNKKMNHPQIG